MTEQPDQTTNEDNAFRAAYVEMLIALPSLPGNWPAHSLEKALRLALIAYNRAKALSPKASRRFADAILNPPEPSQRMRDTAQRYKETFKE